MYCKCPPHTAALASNDAAFYENKIANIMTVCCVGVDHIQRKSVHDSRNQGHLPLAPLRLHQSQVSPSLSIHLSLYLFLRTLYCSIMRLLITSVHKNIIFLPSSSTYIGGVCNLKKV